MKCFAPIHIRKDDPDGGSYVPCGKCPACVANKASQWYVRIKQQLRDSWNAVFVTLTYDSDDLPDARIDNDGYANFDVNRDDIRLYHYRLRKSLGESSKELKYFLVSEYGPNPDVDPAFGFAFERPHYHVIYFNIKREDYEKINQAWNKGNVVFGDEITEARIRYLAGYCIEKCFVPCGRKPNFANISNGMGLSYIARMSEWHSGDVSRMYVPNHGRRLPMPRYYKERLYSDAQCGLFAEKCKEAADISYNADLERFGGDHVKLSQYYSDVRANFIRKQREKHKKRKN